jgi:hypothetical protein
LSDYGFFKDGKMIPRDNVGFYPRYAVIIPTGFKYFRGFAGLQIVNGGGINFINF